MQKTQNSLITLILQNKELTICELGGAMNKTKPTAKFSSRLTKHQKMASSTTTLEDLSYTTLYPAAYNTQDNQAYYEQDSVILENPNSEFSCDDSFVVNCQIPPNQQIYSNLDHVLANLPRDLYIERLITETRSDCELVLWYRRIQLPKRRIKGTQIYHKKFKYAQICN